MNYILLLILLSLLVIGYIQFKRAKEQVNEVKPHQPEEDRHHPKDLVKAVRMQQFWSHQCAKVYKEIHR